MKRHDYEDEAQRWQWGGTRFWDRLYLYQRGDSSQEPDGWMLLHNLGHEEARDRLRDAQTRLARSLEIECADCDAWFRPGNRTVIRCPTCRARRRPRRLV